MEVKTLTLTKSMFPERLRNIPTPPEQLFVKGSNVKELVETHPCVAIVGSRKVSVYGKTVTSMLAGELAKAGVVIISGLALGVDSIAHKAALDAGGLTIAVLPCGLDRIYPYSHRGLASQILEQGGALVTEYEQGAEIYPSNFIARNRIVSGLSNAVLITEAAARSGTLSTARFALEQGIEILAVPGNITSPTSAGTNGLIRTGATPATNVDDILHVLGIKRPKTTRKAPTSSNPEEQTLLDLLAAGIQDGSQILEKSGQDISRFNQNLTMLEIRGQIRPLGNNQWELQ
jgi:DNA processing protein